MYIQVKRKSHFTTFFITTYLENEEHMTGTIVGSLLGALVSIMIVIAFLVYKRRQKQDSKEITIRGKLNFN